MAPPIKSRSDGPPRKRRRKPLPGRGLPKRLPPSRGRPLGRKRRQKPGEAEGKRAFPWPLPRKRRTWSAQRLRHRPSPLCRFPASPRRAKIGVLRVPKPQGEPMAAMRLTGAPPAAPRDGAASCRRNDRATAAAAPRADAPTAVPAAPAAGRKYPVYIPRHVARQMEQQGQQAPIAVPADEVPEVVVRAAAEAAQQPLRQRPSARRNRGISPSLFTRKILAPVKASSRSPARASASFGTPSAVSPSTRTTFS